MEALIYVSTATELPNQRMIDRILDASHRNNPALDLTGMLLWSDMTFAQMLEGPSNALDILYARLQTDPRHSNLRLLSRWRIDQRLFSEWSMASRRLSPRGPWGLLTDATHDAATTANWLLFLMNELRRLPAVA
ncbi:MAG: BLUF domain-containing protein [Rhodobacteraceae bacterium]|nr:MAG: BLUF domain-containing protein [Paracoccaceae bacterium]